MKKYREETKQDEWALVSRKKPDKVLKWFGEEKPSKEAVEKEDKRVQYFSKTKAAALEKKGLQLWEAAPNYMGQDYSDYYVGPGRSRDSELVDLSNFDVALEMLGGEGEGVVVAAATHWAAGWVEQILVHKDAADKVAATARAFRFSFVR